MTTRQQRLRAALIVAFSPTRIVVVDDSAHHAGHAGATPGGETHYSIHMISAAFTGLNRVARSRAVHQAVAAEFQAGLHALSLKLQSPEEVTT